MGSSTQGASEAVHTRCESICVPYSHGLFYIGLVDKDQAFLWLSTTAEETIDPNRVFFGQIRN